MKFKILSLFPEIIDIYISKGILQRGIDKNIISVDSYNIRDYALGNYKQVDDEPYGGGAGMLMRVDVLANALESISDGTEKVILMSPQGIKLSSNLVKTYSNTKQNFILICGRYEGIDQRFIDLFVDEEVSIGDFVLSGGELAALAFVDAVSRFIPGVVGDMQSVLSDSFENNLLKYPQYTRPAIFRDNPVPEVLLSGNHKLIKEWREKASYTKTMKKRADLQEKK